LVILGKFRFWESSEGKMTVTKIGMVGSEKVEVSGRMKKMKG
jgi:hypothetical protein